MSLSPFTPEPAAQRYLRWGSGAGALALLALVLLGLASQPLVRKKTEQWVEVVVQKTQPPPPPEPPKVEPPKPEPPKPKPKQVKFEDIAEKPLPNQPPPPPDTPPKTVRRVQGLSASSFAPGGTTGLTVNAGNSLGVPASKDKMELADATGPLVARAYTAVGKLPKLISAPPMEVPDEARAASIEGTITVRLDLDEKGRVTSVKVVRGLGYGTDEACITAWKGSRWKPGEQDGVPVPVQAVPESCKVILTQ